MKTRGLNEDQVKYPGDSHVPKEVAQLGMILSGVQRLEDGVLRWHAFSGRTTCCSEEVSRPQDKQAAGQGVWDMERLGRHGDNLYSHQSEQKRMSTLEER